MNPPAQPPFPRRSRLARARALALAAPPAVAVAALALIGGCRDAAQAERAAAVCAAVDAERFEEALARSEGGSSAEGDGRRIAECRCIALLSLGDRDACTALLDPLLREPAAHDWVPHPVLTKLMLRTWQARGELAPAAELATRAAPRFLHDLDLLQLELMLRSTQQNEAEVLAALEGRLGGGDEWLPQRLVLAVAHRRRGQHADAIRVLGEQAPPLAHPLATVWYESRIQAQAGAGDLPAVKRTFAEWRAAGADPIELAARYALRLSTDQLDDPERGKLELLREAIASQDRLRDRNIVWGLHRRLIAELLAAGRPEEALAAYDAGARVIDLVGVSREELERAVERASEPATQDDAPAEIVFTIPEALHGGRLLLSPDADAPPDDAYHAHPLGLRRELVVASKRGLHPRRWVARDARGHVRASGSFWPEPGATRSITPVVHPTPEPVASADRATDPGTDASPPPRVHAPFTAGRRAGDGRRRVIAILPDCGDWRLVQYLRARGELPFHEHLLTRGHSAVLESRPAFTAAALQSLVWPAPPRARATLDWVHDLGLELAGLEAVGSNPLAFLGFVLPERPNLFATLGKGPFVAANMLLAHGRIDAGRHAEIVGPDGHHRMLDAHTAYRRLTPAELERFPGLGHDPDTRRFAETIAAELDAALRIVHEGEIDFLFLRLEALDLVTHAHFGPLDGVGQDDARGPLLDTYRYIDARLAELDRALDRDDWLVYLSDHGIRSSMQHEEDAIFAVLGEDVPAGRVPGRPALRGVPRSLAAMFGIATDWPETGVTPWLEVPREAPRLAEAR